uniref:Uncharacterized protein n=1 Tax=Oryzias melastigma TaxID=30732 RepID=A0A3B3B4N7_ORYME
TGKLLKDILNRNYSHVSQSDIVLVCGSDRSIQVVDMNKGGVASTLTDAHSRSIHCITQNKGSRFCTQTSDSYNLFLTSAITDGLKLWDLRTMRCVRRYDSHAICCHPCFSAISPCGRFIATGSEDKCAYIYDIRSSIHLHKLQRHSDTVFSVAFNPLKSIPSSYRTVSLFGNSTEPPFIV